MKKGIISTGSIEATNAAAEILRTGGNAIDAAIAAVFTSMTSEFSLTSAAGGGAMMIKIPQKKPILYDFFVDTPNLKSIKDIEFFKTTVNFGDSIQNFHIGKGSIAIPGNLAGLVKVQKDFGKLPLSVVLEPGIDIARSGCILNKEQSYIFKLLKPIFTHSAESKQLLCRDGEILKEGDRFINLDFSNFLEIVSKEGIDFFYKGEIAKIVENVLQDGGLIDVNSIKNYKVYIREPVYTRFHGLDVFSNPPPSSGGSLIIFLLKLLEKGSKKNFSISKLIDAMSTTNMARYEICNNANNELQYFQLQEDITFDYYLDVFENKKLYKKNINKSNGRGCTTHVSVIDNQGNCASVTTSNGEGSGYVIPGTGIMLNNMLGEDDLNPQGFHNWQQTRRLTTMMSPTIMTEGDKPMLIIGSGGSNRIRSAMVQVIINYIYRKMTLKESISTPRIHIEDNILYHEPDIIVPNNYIDRFTVNSFEENNLFFGGVNAVTNDDGFSDIRRGGSFTII